MIDRLCASCAARVREKTAANIRDNFQPGAPDDFARTVRPDPVNGILPHADALHAGRSIIFHCLRKPPGFGSNGVDTASVECYVFQFGEMVMDLISF